MGTLILMVVIGVIILLGRYVLAEASRVKSQKKFMKNMENYDNKKNK